MCARLSLPERDARDLAGTQVHATRSRVQPGPDLQRTVTLTQTTVPQITVRRNRRTEAISS